MKALTPLLFCAGLGLAASAAWPAASQQATLGAAGELYLARTGSYGDLFPGAKGTGIDAGSAVLALEIVRPGQAAERVLVPGTESTDEEELPALLF